MKFLTGFTKHADFDHNNQGLEFKMSDTSNLYGAGPGGMGPSGYATYEGNAELKPDGTKVTKNSKLHLKEIARRVAMGKIATIDGVPDSLPAVMGYVGSSGQGASTLATQLKYETSGDNKLGYPGSEVEPRVRKKAYLKAAAKGAKK